MREREREREKRQMNDRTPVTTGEWEADQMSVHGAPLQQCEWRVREREEEAKSGAGLEVTRERQAE